MNSRLYGGLGTAAQGRTLDGETGEFIGFTSTVPIKYFMGTIAFKI